MSKLPLELLDLAATCLQDSPPDLLPPALVCRTWSMVFTARLWHSLNHPPIHRPDLLAQLPRRGHHTRAFALIGGFDSALRDLVFASCPHLISLDLTLAKSLNQASALLLAKCLPRLKVLRLNSCHGQAMSWLSGLQALEALQELEFVNSAAVLIDQDLNWDQAQAQEPDDPPTHNFAFASWNDASATESLETKFKELLPDYLGSFLMTRAHTLLRLDLEGSDLQGLELFRDPLAGCATPRLSPIALDGSRQVLALRHLNLAETTVYSTGSLIEPLLRQCPHLETLDLSGNFDEAWSWFQWSILQTYCLKLKSLNLSKMSFIGSLPLVQIVRSCAGLDTLIAAQSNIASEVLEAIVERACDHTQDHLGRSSFLELDVSWCSDVSQEALQHIVERVPTLQSLKFSWCPQVDLSIFQSQWTCVGLEVLEAQGLDGPSPALVGFDLPWERCLFERVSRLECLQRLAIGSNEMVVSKTNGFDMATLQSLRQLQSFELVGNEDYPLGLPEMQALASALVKLKHFHFGLGLVEKKMQTWLAGARPDIQQIETQFYY
ncbi:hypothetical protein BGZ68_010953 [Mortierella alpina]|nr:hypothetical protein BGZ68_010953 [Mortierella alpina]